MKLYTVGHSNDSPEYFLELIRRKGIDAVVDVRRIPYSRHARQFNKRTLAAFLKRHETPYIFMGDHLGGKITDPAFLSENGRIDYGKVMRSRQFLEGICRLENGIRKGFTIALLCVEKNPLQCHRFFLIARFLAQKGYEIYHIVDDRIFDHAKLEEKIRGPLFTS